MVRRSNQDGDRMQSKLATFTFVVPTDDDVEKRHVDAGKEISKTFSYDVCDTEEEAQKVLADKKWTILEMVNNKLKSSARSNSYQNALIPYKPTEVKPEEIRARMIRDFIRMGVSEEVATAQVDGLLNAQK